MKKYVYLSALVLAVQAFSFVAFAGGEVGVITKDVVEKVLTEDAFKSVIEKEGTKAAGGARLKSLARAFGYEDPMSLFGARVSEEQIMKLSAADKAELDYLVSKTQARTIPTVSKVSFGGNSSQATSSFQGNNAASVVNDDALGLVTNRIQTDLVDGKMDAVKAQNALRAINHYPSRVGKGNITDCMAMTKTQFGNELNIFIAAEASADDRVAFKLGAKQMMKDGLAATEQEAEAKLGKINDVCHLTAFNR